MKDGSYHAKECCWKYLNPRNLMTEIHRYGYHFSLTSYIELLFAAFLGMGGIGYLLGLKWNYILIILISCLMLLPTMILSVYKNMFEQKKFVDVSNYIEQLLYSFKRKSKILSALFDTLTLFPKGELHDAITQTIHYIQTSSTKGDIFEEAFVEIEKNYGCQRVLTVHRFLMKVEALGGTYADSAEILIGDRNRWVERIYETQKQKQLIKRNMTIAILFSLVIIGATVLLMPKDFKGVIDSRISQIATTVVMIINIFLWIFVQVKLSGSWMKEENLAPVQNLMRRYHKAMHRDAVHVKGMQKILVIVVCLGALYTYFVMHHLLLTLLFIALAYLLISQPKRTYKATIKRMSREVEKAFPEWMMSMALLLQSDNVHVAMSKTISNAPEILREELSRVLKGIEQNPNSVKPYLAFFKGLDIPDVESSMKMLYSVAEYGASDIEKQVTVIVQRNSVMMDKSQRIKTEDYLAGMGFLVLTPMLTGSGKMLVDMMLLITSLLKFTTLI
ncbi:MAG: hypothetical protein RSD97_06455 [Lachnospiraceae bacterium]